MAEILWKRKILWKLGDFSADIFLKLFDAKIKPMILYGSEIWGLQPQPVIEKVHTFAIERQSPNTKWWGDRTLPSVYLLLLTIATSAFPESEFPLIGGAFFIIDTHRHTYDLQDLDLI